MSQISQQHFVHSNLWWVVSQEPGRDAGEERRLEAEEGLLSKKTWLRKKEDEVSLGELLLWAPVSGEVGLFPNTNSSLVTNLSSLNNTLFTLISRGLSLISGTWL